MLSSQVRTKENAEMWAFLKDQQRTNKELAFQKQQISDGQNKLNQMKSSLTDINQKFDEISQKYISTFSGSEVFNYFYLLYKKMYKCAHYAIDILQKLRQRIAKLSQLANSGIDQEVQDSIWIHELSKSPVKIS